MKNYHEVMKEGITRRSFLRLGIMAAAFGLLPGGAFGDVEDYLQRDRRICVYNLHSKEYLDIVYWQDGVYIKKALDEINYIFRDHYNGRIKKISPGLIDYLFAIHKKVGSREPYHLISGYRTKKTNEILRKHNKNVALKSLHIYGKAADIRLPDRKLKIVRRAAYELRGGGVGYYPRSNFVHIDVGQVRFWRG